MTSSGQWSDPVGARQLKALRHCAPPCTRDAHLGRARRVFIHELHQQRFIIIICHSTDPEQTSRNLDANPQGERVERKNNAACTALQKRGMYTRTSRCLESVPEPPPRPKLRTEHNGRRGHGHGQDANLIPAPLCPSSARLLPLSWPSSWVTR